MSLITFVAVILAVWSIFHILQNFLISNNWTSTAYLSFLLNNHVGISLCHIRWFTTRWNRLFNKLGNSAKFPWRIWFNCGVFFGIIAMGTSTILLIRALDVSLKAVLFTTQSSPQPNTQVLTVIVPGVNLPLNEIGYLIAAVFISGILHECGHAIAAAREGVCVNGFGVFIFILYPGAFVDLNSNELNSLGFLKQLRIYCAGVWHNFLTCIFACIMILSLPYFLAPIYSQTQQGALITQQTANSPLDAPNGLKIGSYVTQIGQCKVSTTNDWYHCLNKIKNASTDGSCLSENLTKHMKFPIDKNFDEKYANTKWMDCCGADAPSTHICYSYDDGNTSFTCLPGRTVMTKQQTCRTNFDCSKLDNNFCYKPFLAPGISFVHIISYPHPHKESSDVLFVGDLNDIYSSVTVSDYYPRWFFVPYRLPEMVLRFWQYMFSISGALALLNIVPSYALDGQWAFTVLLEFGLVNSKYRDNVFVKTILHISLGLGTLLIAANILVGFYYISFFQ